MTHPRRSSELAMLGVALLLPSVATYIYFILLSGKPLMQVAYSASKAVQFSLPVLWVLLICRERIRRDWFQPKGMITGIAFGIATLIAILGLYFGLLKGSAAFSPVSAAISEKVKGMGALSPGKFIVLGAFISLIHSLLEEYYWRWFIFARLRLLTSLTTAIVISSVGFMAHHVLVVGSYLNWQHWPLLAFFSLSVAIGGAFWAWLYHRTGSIVAPWMSHLIVDCSLMIIGYDQLWGL